jgi:ABC-2 type transport system permease protein
MRFEVIAADFSASIKGWLRSKGTLFWTLAFPIMLILIFGAIFSGTGQSDYTLYVQDLDDSDASHGFLEGLNQTDIFSIKNVAADKDIQKYIDDNSIKQVIVIPSGFEEKIQKFYVDPSSTVAITYYFDPGEQQTSQTVQTILESVIQHMNMNLSNGRNIVTIKPEKTITQDYTFIDFFLPGMIGFTIMQTSIYGSIERNTKYRKVGILRKLLTTPITRGEWMLAKMLFMLFLSFVSTTIIILVGVLVWNVRVNINPLMIIILIATSFLFSGMGTLIGRFVKEEETADTAGGAISFPMMFLAGTFFPLEQMPEALQTFARILPLYYVNEGLRNAMIYLNESEALINMIAVVIFASVFFIAGVVLTKWKED